MTTKAANSAKKEVHYGVTPPINTSFPSEDDQLSTRELRSVLQHLNLYEEEEEGKLREETLGALNSLVQIWIQKESAEQQMDLTMNDESADVSTTSGSAITAKIFTFGSYRLGVHGPGTDIDTLCVGPRHISRQHFFTGLHRLLAADPRVTDLITVPDAYVPIMKFKMNGIDFDLMYVQLASVTTVTDSFNIFDDNNLRGIDPQSVLSLNGCRVTDMILSLVPNIPNFRTTLRAIKHWAQSEYTDPITTSS